MSYTPSDDECDAAQIAEEEYVHGHRTSTRRDLGITRGAMRAALIAAHEHREKENTMSKNDARKIEAILDQVTTLNGRETELLAEALVERGVTTKENTK